MTPLAARIAEAGRRAFPDVTLADDAIEDVCAARADDVGSTVAAELFLALACGRGDACALAYLEASHIAEVRRLIAARSSNPAHVDEVLQRLRATVLAPRHTSGRPRAPEILSYTGAGPLLAWLRIAALRILIRLEQTERRGREVADAIAEVLPRIGDPERALHRRSSSEALRRALWAAWHDLDAEDRLRLRVRYADGHGIDHVARLEGVHRATAARRLLRAEERLVAGTRAILRRSLRLSDGELDSVLRGLHSQHELTLGSLLREADGAPRT